MALAHQFAEQLDVAGLECRHGVDGTLAFAHHMLRTLQGHGVFDSTLDLLELRLAEFREVLQVRAHRAQLLHGQLALGHAVVVCARVEFVRRVGVADHHLDALQLDRNQLEVERVAVQIDGMVFLALGRSELVHDAAVDAGELMLAELTDLGKFGLVVPGAEDVVERTGRDHFDGRRAAESRACRHIAPDEDVVTFRHLEAAFDILCDAAHRVVHPAVVGQRFGECVKRERDDLGHVQRLEAHLFFVVFCEQHIRAEAQCTREHMSAVVIGMFANQVHATRSKIHVLCLLIVRLSKSLFQFVQFHDIYLIMFVDFFASYSFR